MEPPFLPGRRALSRRHGAALGRSAIATVGRRDDRRAAWCSRSAWWRSRSRSGRRFRRTAWLYRVFPLLTGIRGAVRFGQFTLAGDRHSGRIRRRGASAPVARAGHAARVAVFVDGERSRPCARRSYYSDVSRAFPPMSTTRCTTSVASAVLAFVPVLRVRAVSPERTVHARHRRDVQADAERLLGIQAGELLRACRSSLRSFPDQASIAHLRAAGRHAS